MKRIILAAIVTASFLISASVSAANKIGVVDLQNVLQNSKEVQQIRKNLQQKFAGKEKEVKQAQTKLQKLTQQYQKNQSVMKPKRKKQMEAKINRERQQLQTLQMTYQRQYIREQNKQLSQFINKVKGVVSKLAAKNNYDLVIEKSGVAYSKDDMDITQQVLDKLQ